MDIVGKTRQNEVRLAYCVWIVIEYCLYQQCGWSDEKTVKFFQPETTSLNFRVEQLGAENQGFDGYRWENKETRG